MKRLIEMAVVARNVGSRNMKVCVDSKAHYPRFNVRTPDRQRVSIDIPKEMPQRGSDLFVLTGGGGQQDKILSINDLNDLVEWMKVTSPGERITNLDKIKMVWNHENGGSTGIIFPVGLITNPKVNRIINLDYTPIYNDDYLYSLHSEQFGYFAEYPLTYEETQKAKRRDLQFMKEMIALRAELLHGTGFVLSFDYLGDGKILIMKPKSPEEDEDQDFFD